MYYSGFIFVLVTSEVYAFFGTLYMPVHLFQIQKYWISVKCDIGYRPCAVNVRILFGPYQNIATPTLREDYMKLYRIF